MGSKKGTLANCGAFKLELKVYSAVGSCPHSILHLVNIWVVKIKKNKDCGGS